MLRLGWRQGADQGWVGATGQMLVTDAAVRGWTLGEGLSTKTTWDAHPRDCAVSASGKPMYRHLG